MLSALDWLADILKLDNIIITAVDKQYWAYLKFIPDDTETEISGKIGASYGVSEDLGIYAELSGATNGEDSDGDTVRDYAAKIGAKFTF